MNVGETSTEDNPVWYEAPYKETPLAFVIFVCVAVAVSFFSIVPLACYRRYYERKMEEQEPIEESEMVPVSVVQANHRESAVELPTVTTRTESTPSPSSPERKSTTPRDSQTLPDLRQLEARLSMASRDLAPDFAPGEFIHARRSGDPRTVLSAATTTRLRSSLATLQQSQKREPPATLASSTIQSMRNVADKIGWTPISTKSSAMRRFVNAERLSAMASEQGSAASRSQTHSWHSRPGSRLPSHAGGRGLASNAASLVLAGEMVEGESDYYRQRFVERQSRRSRRRSVSSSALSDRSLMPPLPGDALAPEDAADADDPGRANPFAQFDVTTHPALMAPETGCLDPTKGCWMWCSPLLDLVEPDYEVRRILARAVPSVLGTVADPCVRLVLIAIIAHYIDTASMVAFVLVIIFLRLTFEEVSGAIRDTETTMIQMAMSEGGEAAFYLTGQYMQLALLMQLLIVTPILIAWIFLVDDLVGWLLSHDLPKVALRALQYTQVIWVEYLVRGTSKTFLLPFHLDGPAQFETIIDVVTAALTMIILGIIVAFEEDRDEKPTIVAMAVVQVIATVVSSIVKVTYVVARGWFEPFRKGFFGQCTFRDPHSIWNFLRIAGPLFVGSLIELREWELLILIVHALGASEVACWALMGVIWEVMEAAASGLGEAGAVRVSYYMAENQPMQARKVSNKLIFLAVIQSLCIGSIFIMLAPNIALVLTSFSVFQGIFNELVGMTALANFSMTMAQVYWSLVGAQGRFGVASVCIIASRWLVIWPTAAVCVFGFSFDIVSVAGAMSFGYAIASLALGMILMQSDWLQLALAVQAQFAPLDHEGAAQEFDENDLDDDSSDDDDDQLL